MISKKHIIDELDLESMSLDNLFSRVLMCSYLYYEAIIESPWTDNQFDFACKKLHDNYDQITHINKDMLSKDLLAAGSGFGLKYTNRIKAASCLWKEIYKEQFSGKII